VTALTRLLGSTPFRLALAYMGGFALVAALVVGFIAWRANDLLTTKVVETLEAEVVGLREQYQAGGTERLAAIVAQRSAEPGSGLYLLVDASARKVAGNLDRVPTELEGAAAGGVFRYVRRTGERRTAEARTAVGVPLPVPGGLVLIVGRDIEDLSRFARTMGQLGLWGIALLAALGIGAGLAVSRSLLRRIEAITGASRAIMAGDLSKRLPLHGSGDELDRLSESLNAMLARIEELIVALREVSDNIAHDLKTPLNRLRNRAEAALREPDGAASYREGLVKTIEEADDLIKTFNSLLLIARLEAGAVQESMAPVDPASIVADVSELYEPVAEEAGLALETHAAPGLSVLVNRELVGQAVANLVDNAIKYSQAEPRAAGRPAELDGAARRKVTIALNPVGDKVEIVVADQGPGVAPEDRERALKRFVRLEKSRTRPGSGLGLSLAAAVARLHGGSVRLEDNAPGLRALLTLPVRSASAAPADSLAGADGKDAQPATASLAPARGAR
jgi:signal transduction histidine kinase